MGSGLKNTMTQMTESHHIMCVVSAVMFGAKRLFRLHGTSAQTVAHKWICEVMTMINDIIRICDVVDGCDDCPRYGDDCDGEDIYE